MDINETEVVCEVAKTATKEVYGDLLKPSVRTTGEILNFIPRTLKTLCSRWDIWLYQKEQNVKAVCAAIDEKMKAIPESQQVEPAPYIAIPALQNMSYCVDNDELREMYANLLANSMCDFSKKLAHPAYVEILKQLSPDEAKIIRYLYKDCIRGLVPAIDVVYEKERDPYKLYSPYCTVLHKFTTITEDAKCECVELGDVYLDNILRLGFVNHENAKLEHDELYEKLKSHQVVKYFLSNIPQNYINCGYVHAKPLYSFYKLTPFGEAFCKACLDEPNVNSTRKN